MLDFQFLLAAAASFEAKPSRIFHLGGPTCDFVLAISDQLRSGFERPRLIGFFGTLSSAEAKWQIMMVKSLLTLVC